MKTKTIFITGLLIFLISVCGTTTVIAQEQTSIKTSKIQVNKGVVYEEEYNFYFDKDNVRISTDEKQPLFNQNIGTSFMGYQIESKKKAEFNGEKMIIYSLSETIISKHYSTLIILPQKKIITFTNEYDNTIYRFYYE